MGTSNNASVDLAAYCTRIGYAGELDPTLTTLTSLIEHHVAAIPFENIDVLLKRGIDISPAAVDEKLIEQRRGGYCFEHNGLFRRVLTAIGFQVESLAARVVWRAAENDAPRPRTHCALRVTLDGEAWLVDVGFGGWVATLPLRLAQTTPQRTGHEAFRVVPGPSGGIHIIETELDGIWRQLYELSPEPLLDVDFEPLNWFTSAHPSSAFLKNLMVARTTGDIRYMLMNGRLTIRHRDGSDERRVLNADELGTTLSELFGLTVEPAWQPLLKRIAEATD
ncbi:MAG TPA: arylamine N-acetyltransferase [Herbaspirillum sp.]|jgi:N-hydroxyarylamine O-acetyltransferase